MERRGLNMRMRQDRGGRRAAIGLGALALLSVAAVPTARASAGEPGGGERRGIRERRANPDRSWPDRLFGSKAVAELTAAEVDLWKAEHLAVSGAYEAARASLGAAERDLRRYLGLDEGTGDGLAAGAWLAPGIGRQLRRQREDVATAVRSVLSWLHRPAADDGLARMAREAAAGGAAAAELSERDVQEGGPSQKPE